MGLLAQITWNADPVMLELGPLQIRWYGLLFGLGFVASFVLVRSMFRREGRNEEDVEHLLLTTIIGTIIGARLVHCFFYDWDRYAADPLSILRVWEGGLASHGGMIGILIALFIHSKRRTDQPFLWLVDRVAVAGALAGSFVRVGNFVNSEIIGTPTDLPWGVTFPRNILQTPVPRHPAQLYEAIAYLLTFVVLFGIYRRLGAKTPTGLLVGTLFVLGFGARFCVEFVKVRQAEGGDELFLSMGQQLTIPVVLLGVVLVVLALRRRATGS